MMRLSRNQGLVFPQAKAANKNRLRHYIKIEKERRHQIPPRQLQTCHTNWGSKVEMATKEGKKADLSNLLMAVPDGPVLAE
jgi:hypothetical protein